MIKNLIFDVGDVLIEYRWRDMMMDQGFTREDTERIGGEIFEHPLWRELDLGNLSQEEVIEGFQREFPADGDEIAWFLRHGELMNVPRPKVWEKVHQLKEKGYKIYLLSNYSEELFRKHTREASFMDDIDGKVVSYEIHEGKPDEAIYRHLLDTYGLVASESMFFDDRAENVETARRLGIQAHVIQSQEQLLSLLEEREKEYGR